MVTLIIIVTISVNIITIARAKERFIWSWNEG